MADIAGKLNGKLVTWVVGATSDKATINVLSGQGTKGIQIETPGFDLATATVTVYSKNGAAKVVTVPAGSEYILVGTEGFVLSKIVVTGVAVGSKPIAFTSI